MTAQVLSYLFTFLGLVGFWLAGKKVWWCWYVNIANQILWMAFALITGYYALIIGSLFYFGVFAKNAYLWTIDHFYEPEVVDTQKTSGVPVDFKVNVDISQFNQGMEKVRRHLPEISLSKFKTIEQRKGEHLRLNGEEVFISETTTPTVIHHICHAGTPPHDHSIMCPTGEHPTGWQHVPGPHKMCDICR